MSLSSATSELCQQRLGEWLTGLEMPPLDDPRRRLEELSLGQLRNFFLLLLARFPEDFPATPLEALERVSGSLESSDAYQRYLALPLRGTPDQVVTEIGLGLPSGELFALQARLTDELTDEGRELLLQLARLF